LAPLAAALRLDIELDPRFNELANPAVAAQALRDYASPDGAVVVCSQGALIPGAVSALNGGSSARYRVGKGDGWVMSFADGHVASLDVFSLRG
jgi:8-oxo-dGTP diphosphatase